MKRTAIIISIFSSLSGLAQTDTLDLSPVEVSSTRASKLAPFTKTNLTKADIEKQNLGQDLPFLLNQTPSVVVNSDAGNGVGYTGIRIRGADATRINVTLNGVPFNDAESGGTFFVDLPDFASSANSIQIQRGVGTSSNGAGAFGATINLSTNEVIKERAIELNSTYGSFNTLKNTLSINSGLLGKYFTLDGRLSRIGSDGYIDRATSNLKSYYVSGAFLKDKTTLRFTSFGGKEKTYQAWNGVSAFDLQDNRTINYAGMEKPGEPYANETDNYTQNHYQLFLNQRLSPSLVFNTGLFLIKGKGYYEQYKAGEGYADYGLTAPDPSETETDLVRQLWLDNDFYGNIFSFQYTRGATVATLGGAVTQYDGDHFGEVTWAEKGLIKPTRWYENKGKKSDWNVYGKWQQKISTFFHLYTDLQVRSVRHTINGFRDNPSLMVSEDYNFFNPKAGVTYANKNWTAYISYGIANKEPNRSDFEAGVNELPKPERLYDLELGVENKYEKTNWSATLYHMQYKDQLVLTGKINDVGAYTRTNIDDSYRLGLELQGGLLFTKWLKANANLALSKNKINDFKEFIDDYDAGGQQVIDYPNTDIAFSPEVVAGGTVTILPYKNISLDLTSKYVSKQYLDNTADKNRMLDAYYTQDAMATYSFSKKWLKKVSVIAQVNNLFNELYEPNGYTFSYIYNGEKTTENYYFPMAGRNWMLGLNIKL